MRCAADDCIWCHRWSRRNPESPRGGHVRASQMCVPSPGLHPAGDILEAVAGLRRWSCQTAAHIEDSSGSHPNRKLPAQLTPHLHTTPPRGLYRLTRNCRHDASCYKAVRPGQWFPVVRSVVQIGSIRVTWKLVKDAPLWALGLGFWATACPEFPRFGTSCHSGVLCKQSSPPTCNVSFIE